MISRLFSSLRSQPRGARSSIPSGERVYAVGDIHGRFDLVQLLVEQVLADDAARGPAQTSLIFLGDLVDRGPESAQVVEFLRQLHAERPHTRFLLGNHEEVMLKAVRGDEKALAFFCKIGGRETILSYGITEHAYRDAGYSELMAMFQARVPQAHIDFLEQFEDLILIGDYAFVHAGVRPDEPLANQKAANLRWIRDEFLDHRGPPLEKIVVHGHTVSDEIEVRSHRIGLDTGAYASGKLSAMGFEHDQRWAVQSSL